MLTDQEKWYFDHHGFIILPQVILGDDIERMLELGDRWHGMPLEDLPHPLTSTADTHPDYSPTIARWINHIQYSDPVFQRLALNPEIMRVIISLTHSYPVLVDTALTKNYRTSDDIHFHASDQEYEIIDDKPFAGFLNAAISLVDVPKETGFVCLPGSHKRHFQPPVQTEISIYDGTPTVINLPLMAGDCLIFTEMLFHGARRWTADYPRFTIFNRYRANLPDTPPVATYGGLEDSRDLIPESVYELQQPTTSAQPKHIVQQIIANTLKQQPPVTKVVCPSQKQYENPLCQCR